MKQKLIDILESFGYPVFLQGSLGDDEVYPDSFITFWTLDSFDNSHYDDNVSSIVFSFNICFYSNNPILVNTKPREIITALKNADFIMDGYGYDLLSDEKTHTGWGINVNIIEEIQNN